MNVDLRQVLSGGQLLRVREHDREGEGWRDRERVQVKRELCNGYEKQ